MKSTLNSGTTPSAIEQKVAAETQRISDLLGSEKNRRVLIVGGAGYIGVPVSRALLAAGLEVRCLDQLTYENGSAVGDLLLDPNYSFLRGDMGQPATLEEALAGVTDVIILAGLVGDPITKKFPQESHDINDLGIRNCIDALNGRGLQRVIFVSTCSNYGLIEGDELATETSDLKPLSLYAKSKVAAEKYILSLHGQVDYSPTILRFATAFGLAPRMRFDLTVNEFTRELAIGNELIVFDAHTWRPYCHVKDFARLIHRVLHFPEGDVAFEVFNAGGDENNHTKQSIVDLIRDRLPNSRVSFKANSSDPRNYRVSFEKVRNTLGFEPAFSVADGVEEILFAIREGILDDVDTRRNFYGNYALPGLASAAPNVNTREVA